MVASLKEWGLSRIRQDTAFARLLSNAGWLFSATTLVRGLGFAQNIIVARMLGVELFGTLALITTITTTVNQFVDSRVWETIVKYVGKFIAEEEHDRAAAVVKLGYLIDFTTASTAFLIVQIVARWAASTFLKDPNLAPFVRFYAVTILFSVPVGTSSALLKIGNRFDQLAYLDAISAIIKFIGVVVIWWLGAGLQGVLIIYTTATLVGGVVAFVFGQRAAQALLSLSWWRVSLDTLRDELRSIARFLVATNANAFFKLFRLNADVLVIGYFLSPVEVGLFQAAKKLSDLLRYFVFPLYSAGYPEYVRLWSQGKHNELRDVVRKVITVAGTISLLGILTVWLFGGWLINFSMGQEYLSALPALRWLVVAAGLGVTTNLGHPVLLAIGKELSSLAAIAVGVFAQFLMLMILVPGFGIIGAAWTVIGFYIVWTLIAFAFLRKESIL